MADEEELGDAMELIGLVEGTVKDLKQYVRENDLSKDELEQVLEAEKNAKNRKTARQFLRGRIEKKDDSSSEEVKDVPEAVEEGENEPGEDIESEEVEPERVDREELLKILGGNVDEMKEWIREKQPGDEQLQEILHAEKIVNDRKTAVKFLKSYSKKSELKEDIQKAEHDFRELREDLNRIELEVMDEDIELSGIDLDEEELDEEGSEAVPEGSDAEEDTEEEEIEEDDEEEVDEEKEQSEEDSEESDETEESGDIEEKKEIAEELDVDLTEEQLEDISLDELKAIQEEKEIREELIDELSDQFDEEKLKDASTSDLEKLKDNIDEDQNIQEQEDEDTEDQEQDSEEIKEEAQEDLEMLMGAVKSSGRKDTEESKDRFEGIKNLRSNIKDRLSFGGEEEEGETGGINESKMMELLDEYRELEKYEAAIKTAHIMKGFLEYSEGIDREMTYKELADEIDPESEEMEEIVSFFKDMNTEQYTGNITADMDKVIDNSRKVVKARS